MATKSLTFDIYGRDKSAGSTLRGLGNDVDGLGGKFKKFGAIAAVGLAAVAAGAIKFGADSVRAYADAEQAQNRLAFAYEQFPALADTNIEAMRRLNDEMAKKTRYDDEAYALGQAQLAQYGLTGTQLMELTPLLADYAGKTGKDLPAAAEDLGKALLGQGRALKDIGIDFTDTGSLAGNFDAIMQGLRKQVGGFAEQDATTAAGKLDILNNKFGEMQEAVGQELIDPLVEVMDTLEKSGAIDDMATTIGDIATAFSDLEKNTGWISGFIKDMSGFSGFVDDIERWGAALGNIGNPEERENWADDRMAQGGLLGDYLTIMNKFGEDWQFMWTGVHAETERGVSGVRGGMGGGLSAMGMDIDAFRASTGEKFGGTWTDANGRTVTGVGGVAGSTGAGLADVLGRVAGWAGQVAPRFGTAWQGANSQTVGGWGNIESSTGAGVGRVGAKVGTIPGVVQGPFAGAGSWLASAGTNIVNGLINGITGMIGAAAQAAARLAAATIAAAKSALGIHSPSKEFEYLGDMVGAGFSKGAVRSLTMAQSKIESMLAAPLTMDLNGRASAAGQSATSSLVNSNNTTTIVMQPMRDNDPHTTATILGREFARRVAG